MLPFGRSTQISVLRVGEFVLLHQYSLAHISKTADESHIASFTMIELFSAYDLRRTAC